MAQVCDVRTAESKAVGSHPGAEGLVPALREPCQGLVPISLSPSRVLCSQADTLLAQLAIWALGILPTPSNADCCAQL